MTDEEKALELLRKAEMDRVDKCTAEIEAVLLKYNCTMMPQHLIRGTGILAQVAILPANEKNPPPTRMPSTSTLVLSEEKEADE